jgi:hypothetical protein
MRLINSLVLCICLGGADSQSAASRLVGTHAGQSQVTIDATVNLLVGSEEPEPITAAAEDLASDMEKVFGKKPVIAHSPTDAAVTILIGFRSPLAARLRPPSVTQPESFSISLAAAPWRAKQGSKVVVLSGPDMRGAMFAVYEFAQDYLGIDPLYYWTDHEPSHRSRIDLPPGLNKTFPPPVFKYRGFFINDEDLLSGWAPGSQEAGSQAEATGISLEAWNKIYETILRLKGNIVAPGTWIFSDEPQIRLAAKRGLIVTQHHAIPLGLNVARWPKDVPYSYSAHPEILERAWKDAVAAYPPGVDVLWTVGLRGLSDVSYAALDPSVRGNDQALGHLISKAIASQMQIVRERRPDASFITNLWQEGAKLVQQGDLSIPAGVGVVWADDGYGYLDDKGQVAAGQGAYYHVAMMNGRANQLTEMVPVDRIYSELGRYIKAHATNYLLLNTSDIRPVSMTTKAVMDLAWRGVEAGNAEDFYRQWSAAEFGEAAASKVAALYQRYFETPAHSARAPGREYGDQYYHTEARTLLLSYMINAPLYSLPSQSPLWTIPRVLNFPGDVPGPTGRERLAEMAQPEMERCREAQPRWDALWNQAIGIEQIVTPERKPFYAAHVLAMIAIGKESNRILALSAEAVQKAATGDRNSAHAAAQQALAAVDEIHKAESAAEYGKWKNWYRGDWLTNVNRTAQLLSLFAAQMQDPLSPLPPPVRWEGWEAYHHIMQYEGDRSADVK